MITEQPQKRPNGRLFNMTGPRRPPETLHAAAGRQVGRRAANPVRTGRTVLGIARPAAGGEARLWADGLGRGDRRPRRQDTARISREPGQDGSVS